MRSLVLHSARGPRRAIEDHAAPPLTQEEPSRVCVPRFHDLEAVRRQWLEILVDANLLTHGGLVTNASIGLIVPPRDGQGPVDSAYAGMLGVADVGCWNSRGPRVGSNVT